MTEKVDLKVKQETGDEVYELVCPKCDNVLMLPVCKVQILKKKEPEQVYVREMVPAGFICASCKAFMTLDKQGNPEIK